jgi:hypothetical protein
MGKQGLLDPLAKQFTAQNFSDIFNPIWMAAALGLIIAVILYNVRSRQLHHHEPLRTMQEWLLWTGLTTFGLILIGALFRFYFLFVLLFIVIGVLVFIWVRFYRFPPYIEAYNEQVRRARFFSQARYKQAEATVRTKRSSGRSTRRRRR